MRWCRLVNDMDSDDIGVLEYFKMKAIFGIVAAFALIVVLIMNFAAPDENRSVGKHLNDDGGCEDLQFTEARRGISFQEETVGEPTKVLTLKTDSDATLDCIRGMAEDNTDGSFKIVRGEIMLSVFISTTRGAPGANIDVFGYDSSGKTMGFSQLEMIMHDVFGSFPPPPGSALDSLYID